MKAMLALAYSFGFRKGELLSLKVADVDLMAGTLRLRDSKNGEARQVSLTAETRSLLAECIRGKFSNDALFTRQNGTPVQDFRGTWEVITTAAGCPGLLFHDLRRSAVRNLIRCGVSEHVAMRISGHKTPSVFRRYDIVDADARDLQDAAKKIESGAVSHSLVIEEEKQEETQKSKPVTIQ
jgi:integrase